MQQIADCLNAQLLWLHPYVTPCFRADCVASFFRILSWQAPGARGGYGMAKCGQQLFVFGGVVSMSITGHLTSTPKAYREFAYGDTTSATRTELLVEDTIRNSFSLV